MFYLLLTFSSFFLFSFSQVQSWNKRIFYLNEKDHFCANQAQWFQNRFRFIEKTNSSLRTLIDSCPALLADPTQTSLKAAQSLSKVLVLEQTKLLTELQFKKVSIIFHRNRENPSILIADSKRPVSSNLCFLAEPLEFMSIHERLIVYRESFAGFDILAKNLQWQYANEEVNTL